MSKKDNFVFNGLHVIAWIIFVGLSIEACGLAVNFVFSIYRPEFVQNLYQKLDLSDMYNRSKWVFGGMYGFILVISFLKAYLFYIVVMLMHKMDLANPFSSFVSERVTKIAEYTFSIGILSYIARQVSKNIEHDGYVMDNLSKFWEDSQAFILMAAIIYVIAIIFKKGVELQNENDLTV